MNIDETIAQVEKLYHRVTGQQLNGNSPKHTIQANVDPIAVLEMRLQELHQLIQDPMVAQHLQPWVPPMSVWESEEKILLRFDLPAVSKEDVDISLRGNTLLVTGTRQPLPSVSGFMPRLSETTTGHFQRLVQLPIENSTPEISSSIKEGVLEISIVKQAQERTGKKPGNGKGMQ